MITAEMLKTLSTYTAAALTTAIQLAGYKKDQFHTAKFIGMSNGNQFVYSATFNFENEIVPTKVFLHYDPIAGRVSADYWQFSKTAL